MRGRWTWVVAVGPDGREPMQESTSPMAAPQWDEPERIAP